MITLHDAIFALNSSIVTIRGDVAYDANEQEVAYDMAVAQAKLTELEAAETAAEQDAAAHKVSAVSKLTALGLSADEINALIG
jgi:hypothetical protein